MKKGGGRAQRKPELGREGGMTRAHVLVRLAPGLEANAVGQIQGVQATETLVTADV